MEIAVNLPAVHRTADAVAGISTSLQTAAEGLTATAGRNVGFETDEVADQLRAKWATELETYATSVSNLGRKVHASAGDVERAETTNTALADQLENGMGPL